MILLANLFPNHTHQVILNTCRYLASRDSKSGLFYGGLPLWGPNLTTRSSIAWSNNHICCICLLVVKMTGQALRSWWMPWESLCDSCCLSHYCRQCLLSTICSLHVFKFTLMHQFYPWSHELYMELHKFCLRSSRRFFYQGMSLFWDLCLYLAACDILACFTYILSYLDVKSIFYYFSSPCYSTYDHPGDWRVVISSFTPTRLTPLYSTIQYYTYHTVYSLVW